MRIGLLGGSFDPIHLAHIAMAKKALQQLQLDEVWFLIAKDTPLKDRPLTPFHHRHKMVSMAIKPYRHFKACTIEATMLGKSYTIDTIKELKKRYAYDFYFIMGEDQVAQLDRWKDIDALQNIVKLCAFERNHQEIITPYRVQPLKMDALMISSTDIRNGKFNDVPKEVRQYLWKHQLYLTFIQQSMSDYRYQHSLRVATLCKTLARAHGLNEEKAYIAGLLHDLNKEWKWMDYDASAILLKHLQPSMLQMSSSIWHGYIGRFILRHTFDLQDQDILEAIEHHVLGTSRNKYAMILFIADKLEPGRDYDSTPWIQLCMNNLYKGFQQVLAWQSAYYNKENENG